MVTGGTAGLAVVRALGAAGVAVTVLRHDPGEFSHTSRFADDSIDVPHPEHAEDDFVGALIGLASRHRGSLLIPSSDEAVKALARNKAQLAEHYVVACMDWAIAELFIDKMHTYALAERLGVPAPWTVVPGSAGELELLRGKVDYPCLVKPRESHLYFEAFGRKMATVRTFDEMAAAYREAGDRGLQVLIQELIPGDDRAGVNHNAYVCDGEVAVECTAQKMRLSPPGTGRPRVLVSREVPEVLAPARTMLRGMAIDGFACTEFKRDARDGVYKLMEINGRPNYSMALSVRCGMNFPAMIYEHLIEGRTPGPRAWSTGVYWIDDSDIVKSARYGRREPFGPRDYIRPYVRPHVWATFDRGDLRPFLSRFVGAGRRRLAPGPQHDQGATGPCR